MGCCKPSRFQLVPALHHTCAYTQPRHSRNACPWYNALSTRTTCMPWHGAFSQVQRLSHQQRSLSRAQQQADPSPTKNS